MVVVVVVVIVAVLPMENDVVTRSIASNIFSHVTLSVPCNHFPNRSIQHPLVSAGLSDLMTSNCPHCMPKNIPIFFQWAAYSGRTYLHKSFMSGRLLSINRNKKLI